MSRIGSIKIASWRPSGSPTRSRPCRRRLQSLVTTAERCQVWNQLMGQMQGVALLVRARHNRCLEPGQPKLFDPIRSQVAQAQIEIDVTRLHFRGIDRSRSAAGQHSEDAGPTEAEPEPLSVYPEQLRF